VQHADKQHKDEHAEAFGGTSKTELFYLLVAEANVETNPCKQLKGRLRKAAFVVCAEHVRQLGGASPLPNLMEVKG
jgi:hypothetical protein